MSRADLSAPAWAILEDRLGFQKKIKIKPPFAQVIRLPILDGTGGARCFFRVMSSPHVVYRERHIASVADFDDLSVFQP